jgi:hypothetical protein
MADTGVSTNGHRNAFHSFRSPDSLLLQASSRGWWAGGLTLQRLSQVCFFSQKGTRLLFATLPVVISTARLLLFEHIFCRRNYGQMHADTCLGKMV